jgi:hypothetical protein
MGLAPFRDSHMTESYQMMEFRHPEGFVKQTAPEGRNAGGRGWSGRWRAQREASLALARTYARRIGIVTALQAAVPRIRALVARYGAEGVCTVRSAGIDVAAAAELDAEAQRGMLAQSISLTTFAAASSMPRSRLRRNSRTRKLAGLQTAAVALFCGRDSALVSDRFPPVAIGPS